ncbi:hypothetical protein LLT6_00060 [Lactococcus cremoris subsp. cremoris TIFN6]|uniref:Biotin protein ligase C-terminal domain-containing protein n=1 Tax=Lactococcus cremoris subsp. cremoris TIFN6 TaxID=1234876 RepID=T0SHK9_LACLC|nr:hypothetical protein LLT6_00060 [Lactococcus cremoris subsp. cremoris TIFN6]
MTSNGELIVKLANGQQKILSSGEISTKKMDLIKSIFPVIIIILYRRPVLGHGGPVMND